MNSSTTDKPSSPCQFIPDKKRTAPFFKLSRVNSCSRILIKNGQTLAISYNIINSKGHRLNHFKHVNQTKKNDYQSIYKRDYCIKSNMHAGMKNKPLVPYDPLSYRNRLPIKDFSVEDQRKNEFVLGEPTMINRKRWISTTKDNYRYPVEIPISNSGILSEMTKIAHMKLESIR